MADLGRAVRIPEFPFTNRESEIVQIREFLASSNARGHLLIVFGPSGYGKTRLLEYITNNEPPDSTVLFLRSKQEGTSGFGIAAKLAIAVDDALRERHLVKLGDRLLSLYWTSRQYARGLVPKLARAIPVVGAAAEYSAAELLKSPYLSPAAHVGVIRHALEKLKKRLGDKRAAIVVDDIHFLTQAEQFVLTDLLAIVHETDNFDLRFVFGSRPFVDRSTSKMRTLCERIAADAKLARIDLDPLCDEALRRIGASISSTPANLEPIIAVAAGNPQQLLRSLIELNLSGALETNDGLLRLPMDVKALAQSIGNFLEMLPVTARLVLGTLAVARHGVTVNALRSVPDMLRSRNVAELLEAIHTLEVTRLIKVNEIAGCPNRELGVQIRHDSVRELVRAELCSQRYLEYIYVNEIAADLADRELRATRSAWSSNDESEEFRLRLTIGRAICRREARKPEWVQEAILALQSAKLSGQLDEIVDLGGSLLEEIKDTITHTREPKLFISTLTARAYYHLGRYKDCVDLVSAQQLQDGESLYLAAISHTIVKPDTTSVVVAASSRQKLAERTSGDPWEPLLVLVEAVALQESGQFAKADHLYATFLESGSHNIDTAQYWQFAFAAPLFVDAERAHDLARDAFAWFEARGNDRSAGMAIHNQGYAAMRLRQYDMASSCFEQSALRLNRSNPHEAVFPLNNIGFIHILRGEGEAARSVLTSCLFRRLWAYYEAAVLINLGYASWLCGSEDPDRFLRQIRRTSGMKKDAWSVALEEYAKCVFKLLPTAGAPTIVDVAQCKSRIDGLAAASAVVPYWNVLADELKKRLNIDVPHLSARDGQLAMGETTDPTVSLARPSALCFAHI